jgi:hypothetical protein
MLEEQLKRIADALEKQNALTESLIGNKAPANQQGPVPVAPTPPKVEKKAPKAAPVVEVDPFAEEAAEPALTFDQIKETLTAHAKQFGSKVTIELMKKHGADAAAPKINTIPEGNWKVCFDEASAELKKVKK